MSYIDHNLTAGETVIYQTRLHWIVMLQSVVTACVIAAVAVFFLYYAQTHTALDPSTSHLLEGAGVVCLVAALVALFAGAARRNATEMAVTNHRVVIKRGLMARSTIEMLLSKVESIEVKETTLGRMFGYGTIVIIGTGGTLDPFPRIAHPLQFRSTVQQQIEKLP